MSSSERPPRERENIDPDEQVRPVPKALLALLFVGCVWGAWYLATSEPDASALLGDARTVAAFAEQPVSDKVDGAQVYTGKCAACHQATGAGLPGVFPPLAASEWVTGSERRLIQILLHGIQGPIEVSGTTYNGLMPAWKMLSDAEIAAVATYVRSAFGNQAGAVTSEMVATERVVSAARTAPWPGGAALDTIK